MTRRVALGARAAGVVMGIAAAAVAVGARQARTTWDGVYTVAQAERGAVGYATHCAACHGDDLGGVEMAPALTGAAFYATWEGETLDALYERMRVSMPLGSPGSLSRAENADILSYLLRAGGYPDGAAELDPRGGALGLVTMRTYKPQ